MEGWQYLINLHRMQRNNPGNDMRNIRREMRILANPFALPQSDFIKLYRLSQPMIREVVTGIRQHMPITTRTSAIPLEIKVLTALSFFASGSYQRIIGQDFNIAISQPTVSRCIYDVSQGINLGLGHKIHFPETHRERALVKERFYAASGMPGVIGALDCTHVALVRPHDHEEMFVNRKGFHSLNVQAICDYDMRILNLNARYGGSSNDSFIWRNSIAKQVLEQRYLAGERWEWLVADSGYGNTPFVMTPILDAPIGSPEECYTSCHCRTRSSIERCFGLLKARWRCLLRHRVLHYSPERAASIVNACAILHNMAIDHRLPDPEPLNAEEHALENLNAAVGNQAQHYNANQLAEGRAIRQQLVVRLWQENQRRQ